LVEPTARRQLRVAALFWHTRLFKDKLAKYDPFTQIEGSYSLQVSVMTELTTRKDLNEKVSCLWLY
jgi:hypothetical protein